jgi:hypothetical protein
MWNETAFEGQCEQLEHEGRHRWLLCYETAVISCWASESAAWIAHDEAVIQGLDPDKLAVVEGR